MVNHKVFVASHQRDAAFVTGDDHGAHRGTWFMPRDQLTFAMKKFDIVEFWDHNEGYLGVKGFVTESDIRLIETSGKKWCSAVNDFGFRWSDDFSHHPSSGGGRPATHEKVAGVSELERLRKFKQYVHDRLDAAGIPTGVVTSQECRIGWRLDLVFSKTGSVVKAWVSKLGLRQQGVLLTAVRGCDTVVKDDRVKAISRAFRETILHCHCGDASKAKSFIQVMNYATLKGHMHAVLQSHDHYPHHYLMHLVHASQILAFYGSGHVEQVDLWDDFYKKMCRKFHMNPETFEELAARLDADETSFAAAQ